jgi:putative phosphoesterase
MDSKKLLVLSDSHGCLPALRAVFNWAKNYTPPNDTICAAAFLGDGISDLRRAAEETGFFCEWKLVGGNNDYGVHVQEAAVMRLGRFSFFLCHGHRYSIYAGYHTLVAAARTFGADAVFFGHTHVPLIKAVEGITLINPGSVGRPRSRIGATFAVVECNDAEPLKPEFWGIGARGEILKVSI